MFCHMISHAGFRGREAAKKVLLLVNSPLKGGGGDTGVVHLGKKIFFF